MSEPFEILIDRLKGGQTLKIEEAFAPSFLDVNEPELQFSATVFIKGEAYLTDSHLILHLKASTTAKMPCAVCNRMIETGLQIENFYHTEPIEEIKGAIFDYRELLREALLIELPKIVECNKGNCPERESIVPYLRSQEKKEKTYFPFADMDQ